MHIYIRIGPDIWFGRIFSKSGRMPDIKTIRVLDIRLIYNVEYPVICRITNVGKIFGRIVDIRD